MVRNTAGTVIDHCARIFRTDTQSKSRAWPRLDGSGVRLALRRRPVAPRREIRAQDELALETARFEPAVRLGDLIERDPLGDPRPDDATRQ
jgi:hypothetical protein